MKHLRLITAALTMALAACGKTSTASPDTSSASSVLTVTPITTSVALSGTTTVSVTGGTGVYVTAIATQGTLVQTGSSTYLFTAPATANNSVVTLTVTDSAGATGSGVVLLNGTIGGGTGVTTATCGGSFNISYGSMTGSLLLTQDVSNNVAGYIYLPTYNYYYPVIGSCSGNGITFTNLPLGTTYSGTVASTGGQITISGSVAGAQGAIAFTATSTAVAQAPVAEAQACGGQYSANIAGIAGTLRLVNNGAGQMAGYLLLQNQYYYAITGTCGSTVSLRNVTTGSIYTGTAVFNGASVQMSGSFTLSDGTPYTWTATK